MDSFGSPPPLAILELRLAYGLGVVEFPVFSFLVIGSLFERRSTAGSSPRIRSPIGEAAGTLPSRNRARKACVLWNFISYRISAPFTWITHQYDTRAIERPN